jgi:predicted O-linked N-acetylglucosamine transferase (SPINDLY family)
MGEGTLATQGMLTFVERELCRWEHAEEDLAALRRTAATLPADAALWATVFTHVTLIDDGVEQLRVARSCVRCNTRKIAAFEPVAPRPLPKRLRVGFVSADFHHHATAMLMAEVFEKLDRERFEISLYSYGQDDGTPMRRRLIRAADHFIEAALMTDLEIAQHVRAADVELLIDLKGHTGDARLNILAYRAAPVQASFLGFPGTTGSDRIDYFIGDEIVSPLANAAHFSEKLALMPRCYQPNDRQRPLPAPMTRAEAGLPEDALVLCGFNQPFKLSPEVFDVWCRLLQQLPGAVLWLLQWNETSPALLRAQAQARGIAPERLVFAPKVDIASHLSRFALADLFIDSWPCNGHTTASDALWAGVPVVTFSGQTFASRVAASLLHAVGLPELVCTTLADYERLVRELAADAPRRAALRTHLVAARDSAPLFDSDGYTRDFGALLWTMAERWSQGLAPAHLVDGRAVTIQSEEDA